MSETVGEDTFLVAKIQFSGEGKNTSKQQHKIYNINNNETADIYFYYYIDEII